MPVGPGRRLAEKEGSCGNRGFDRSRAWRRCLAIILGLFDFFPHDTYQPKSRTFRV